MLVPHMCVEMEHTMGGNSNSHALFCDIISLNKERGTFEPITNFHFVASTIVSCQSPCSRHIGLSSLSPSDPKPQYALAMPKELKSASIEAVWPTILSSPDIHLIQHAYSRLVNLLPRPYSNAQHVPLIVPNLSNYGGQDLQLRLIYQSNSIINS